MRQRYAKLFAACLFIMTALASGGTAFAVTGCDALGDDCCRVCTTGRACGDSCIESSRSCNVGPGCACNG